MEGGKGKWMVAVLIAIVALSILALFTTATLGQEENGEPAAKRVSTSTLIVCIVVGWVGNFGHRIKKVIKGETDEAILGYLRNHKIVFIWGLVVAAVAVLAESVTVATEVPSLVFSALLTGYTSDSLFETKETPR